MKQLITAAMTLVLTLALVPAEAATKKKVIKKKPAKEQALSVDIIPIGITLINLGYEHATGPVNSFTVEGLFGGQSSSASAGAASVSAGYSAFGLLGSYRWWLGENATALKGFHVGPEAGFVGLSFNVASSTGVKGTAGASLFLLGGNAGYQWILGDGFLIDAALRVFFGTGSLGTTVDTAGNQVAASFSSILPMPSLKVGWAF